MSDKQTMQMDADLAEAQLKSIEKCYEMVQQCAETMEALRENQTEVLWTSDGKSLELTAALRKKYLAARQWLATVKDELDQAATNLRKAIDETDALDTAQKAQYQTLLHRAVGSPSRNIPI